MQSVPKARLKCVESQTEDGIDVSRLIRKDIEARDWAAVHVAGDRAKPLPFFERVRRTWRG